MDGSLVDLCGATLLWRTAEGLSRTPTVKHLEALRQELNAARPQCPVGFNTLAFPSMRRKDIVDEKQPWVYLNCGHVHGYHNWGNRDAERDGREGRERECPMCRARGPYVPLWLGCEAGFYLDAAPPTHAFSPCGHVCSEKNSSILESNPSSSRNAHLPRRLSFLCPAARRRAGIHQTDLPGACGLNTPAYDLLPSNPILTNISQHFFVFPRIGFYKDDIFCALRLFFFSPLTFWFVSDLYTAFSNTEKNKNIYFQIKWL